jgi:hypothetical protein
MNTADYPKTLIPDSSETHIVNGIEITIPVVHLKFKKWQGDPIPNTFGGKGLIDYEGTAMFAELAIMRTALAGGWKARWVEVYSMKGGKPYYFSSWGDGKLPTQIQDPIIDKEPLNSLAMIAENNADSYFGCWDVILWKGKKVIYVEAKRTKHDRMRITQDRWLEAGIAAGLDASNFIICWWDFV